MYQKKIEEAKAFLETTKGKGIQGVLEAASELVGNPIVLIDLSYYLLAYTKSKVADDPLYNELIANGKFSHETVDFFNTECFIEMFAATENIVVLKSPKLKYDRVSAPLYDSEGLQMGSICIVQCQRLFDDADYKIVEIIVEYLSMELCRVEQHVKSSKKLSDGIVADLIEGGNVPDACRGKILSTLYKGLKKNIYVAVIDILKYDKSLTHLFYFRDLFERIKGDFHYYIYLNNIVAIISTDAPIIGVKRELKELNEFFVRYNIYAGISDSFQNLNDLRIYFKQALSALNCGMEMNYGKNIFMYADFRLEAFIKDHSEEVAKLCHPVVFYIYKYDIENNTNYKHILYTYLLAGRNTERAARFAKMDYEEFSKKLAEVEDIFEIDFTNMNTVFGVFCCMKLEEYFPEIFYEETPITLIPKPHRQPPRPL